MGMFIPGHVLRMPRERGIKRNRPYHVQPTKSTAPGLFQLCRFSKKRSGPNFLIVWPPVYPPILKSHKPGGCSKEHFCRQKSNFLHQKHFLSKFHPFYITPSFCTHREKIDLADSEKRTPEVKIRPFFIIIPKKSNFAKKAIKSRKRLPRAFNSR